MMQIYINNRMGWEEGGEKGTDTQTHGEGDTPPLPCKGILYISQNKLTAACNTLDEFHKN